MHHPAEPSEAQPAKLARTRRIQVIAGVLTLAVVLPISWRSFRERTAEAQNPMGDDATAAVETLEAPPVVPDPEQTAVAAATRRFGSSAADATACLVQHQQRIATAAAAQRADSTARRPGTGRDPVEAERYGWYPSMPDFLDGAILPCARIVAYYGHPNSTRMGVLGEYPKDEMLRRLKDQVAEWERADPTTPVIPALHMVAVVAQGEPGTTGLWRSITADSRVQDVYDWAQEVNGIFFVDIQVGLDDIRNLLPRFEWILKNPDVHVGIDPEFMMKDGTPPGRKIGTMDAADINFAIDYLAELTREHNLPPKVLVIHRFTQRMVTNYQNVRLRPEVQVVMHMDGHGRMQGPLLKYDTYSHYVVREPVQFAGWKNFYLHDNEKGVMPTAADLMRLHPLPLYLQYQ
ncbi:MAG TPA: hypothetical protein VK929_07210 [Longimicrobiales bacterium]|nr:hypothetical protein [Longimicrobiales bacterium]